MKTEFSTIENILKKVDAKLNISNKKFEYPKIEYSVFEKRDLILMKINESIIYARTFVSVEEPYPDRVEGKLKLTFNSSQIIEPLKELWSPNLEALEYGRVIERGLRKYILDLSKLVVNEKEVFSITIELHCVSVDGNVIDCGFYAALQSLKLIKIPFEKYNIPEIQWLNLNCFCKTVYVFENKLYQNTSIYETNICETGLTLIIADERIVAVQKLKGEPVNMPLFKEMVNFIFDSEKYINIKKINNIWTESNIYKVKYNTI